MGYGMGYVLGISKLSETANRSGCTDHQGDRVLEPPQFFSFFSAVAKPAPYLEHGNNITTKCLEFYPGYVRFACS